MALTETILKWVAERPPAMPPRARGGYDRAVDALNRLPRPILAFGTLVMLVWGMLWPDDFANRMQAIEAVPEPMWWLMGAVITFYFGARETHYLRARAQPPARAAGPAPQPAAQPAPQPSATHGEPNAALAEWRAAQGVAQGEQP